MKALTALRRAFRLKENEELGRKFSPEVLKRIVDAMKDYAGSKCNEQRVICQGVFNDVYDLDDTEMAMSNLYILDELKECEAPELD